MPHLILQNDNVVDDPYWLACYEMVKTDFCFALTLTQYAGKKLIGNESLVFGKEELSQWGLLHLVQISQSDQLHSCSVAEGRHELHVACAKELTADFSQRDQLLDAGFGPLVGRLRSRPLDRRPGALGDFLYKGDFALRPGSRVHRTGDDCPQRVVLAFPQSRGDQRTHAKGLDICSVAVGKALHFRDIVDHQRPVRRNLKGFRKIGQTNLGGQRGQAVIVNLMRKFGSVFLQSKNPNVAAMESHLRRQHLKRPVRHGLGAGLCPKRVAELEQECLPLLALAHVAFGITARGDIGE